MAIGRNRIREKAPLPQGLLLEQGFRWAKLLCNWLRGFSDTTAVSTASGSATYGTYNLYLSVSVTSSIGNSSLIAFQVRDAFGSAVTGYKQLRFWTAGQSAYGRPQGAGIFSQSPSVIVSSGTLIKREATAGYKKYTNMLTDGAGRSVVRLRFGTNFSTFVSGQLAFGKPYPSPYKLKYSVTNPAFYLFFSVGSESSNWIPVHVEARKSADNTRLGEDLTIAVWFAGTQWGLAGNVPSVQYSGGAHNIATLDTNPDAAWLHIRSTGANIIKLNQTGNTDWYVHGVTLHGVGFAASVKADFS